ncbi:MAG TPA: circularly permuted type 2 ATP-grasp protein, partial [Bryobacteraceae bacterium]|nr:circularly permuted type 2 ATP-grasp protein [Bryobacteraceae bacterium]
MSTAASNPAPNQLPASQMLFDGYDPGPFYDELIAPDGRPRQCAAAMYEKLANMPLSVFEERRKLADLSYLVQGITFTVYSDGRGTERLFPFDLVPRIIPRSEWDVIERGLEQRVTALNLYLRDIYGPQRILRDRIIPRNLVFSCKHFRREMAGLTVARDIYVHIAGIDLVRDSKTGQYLVLEDNARSPSGISYVLENRLVMRRTFPRAFEVTEVQPVDHYPAELARILRSLSPR